MIKYFCLLVSAFIYADVCYFMPPDQWEIAQLKKPSSHIQIGFIGKGETEFRPSINLAIEEIDVPLKGYLQSVKELHLQNKEMSFRDLGPFAMKGGKGRLLNLTTQSPWGEQSIFQAILVKKGFAYILTASCLKQELPKMQKKLISSLKSLNCKEHLLDAIEKKEEKEEFEKLYSALKETSWNEFVSYIQTLEKLGPYWQFLALKQGKEKIVNQKGSL